MDIFSRPSDGIFNRLFNSPTSNYSILSRTYVKHGELGLVLLPAWSFTTVLIHTVHLITILTTKLSAVLAIVVSNEDYCELVRANGLHSDMCIHHLPYFLPCSCKYCLLEFYIFATSRVISGWVLTCDTHGNFIVLSLWEISRLVARPDSTPGHSFNPYWGTSGTSNTSIETAL